jgi:hypothetical protein
MAITAASKSIPECIASDIIETDPVRRPTMILNKTKEELEATDNIATLSLRCCIFVTSVLQISCLLITPAAQ